MGETAEVLSWHPFAMERPLTSTRSFSRLALALTVAGGCGGTGSGDTETEGASEGSGSESGSSSSATTTDSGSGSSSASESGSGSASSSTGSGSEEGTSTGDTGESSGETTAGETGGGSEESGDTGGETEGVDPGPDVDRTNPDLHENEFTAEDADEEASVALGTQLGFLDTRVEPIGRLVIYLHGADEPSTCGSRAMAEVLAGMGFHTFHPCYVANYGVGNCGDDIAGCRLEAFEGVDHHDFIDIAPSDALEPRIVAGLNYLQEVDPGGDWQYFLDGDAPKWSKIVISGISHGASSSAVIGKNRDVARVVSLSGPADGGQAWLTAPSITPIDRFYAFTHTDDDQHAGHLESFADLGLPGDPTSVDDADPPYADSHRLITSAQTDDGHTSTQAGGSSPMDGDAWVFQPVWEYLFGK